MRVKLGLSQQRAYGKRRGKYLYLKESKLMEARENSRLRIFIKFALHHIFYQGDQSRRIKLAVHVAYMGEMLNAYKIWVQRSEDRRSLATLRHGQQDNIKQDFKERLWEKMDWITTAQNRDKQRGFVKTVMNF